MLPKTAFASDAEYLAYLRDWFAGQALPGVIAAACSGNHTPQMLAGETSIVPAMARNAYELADAALAARGGEQ